MSHIQLIFHILTTNITSIYTTIRFFLKNWPIFIKWFHKTTDICFSFLPVHNTLTAGSSWLHLPGYLPVIFYPVFNQMGPFGTVCSLYKPKLLCGTSHLNMARGKPVQRGTDNLIATVKRTGFLAYLLKKQCLQDYSDFCIFVDADDIVGRTLSKQHKTSNDHNNHSISQWVPVFFNRELAKLLAALLFGLLRIVWASWWSCFCEDTLRLPSTQYSVHLGA